MPQLCFLAGLYIVFLVWVSQCLHHHQSQALYFLQGTCSHSVSFHPYPSTYRHRSDTERLQMLQCSLHSVFPFLPCPLPITHGLHSLYWTHFMFCKRRKPVEMRKWGTEQWRSKVSTYFWCPVWDISVSSYSSASPLQVTKGRVSLVGSCLMSPGPGSWAWLIPPSTRALSLENHHTQKPAKYHSTTKIPLLCQPGIECTIP